MSQLIRQLYIKENVFSCLIFIFLLKQTNKLDSTSFYSLRLSISCSSVVEERCYPYIGDYKVWSRCKVARGIRSLKAARCSPQHTIEPPRAELYRTGPAYRIKSEQDIMHEILESGPVQGECCEFLRSCKFDIIYIMRAKRRVSGYTRQTHRVKHFHL